MGRTRYTALYRRFGNRWAISVPALRLVHAHVTRLDQAKPLLRKMIAETLNVPADSFDIQMHPATSDQEFPGRATASCDP